jgi:DNA-directed RNA polymerase subunit N (RpoN/RPB10)
MIIPIRCFTCGKVLADKYDYYVAEARKLSSVEEAPAAIAKASTSTQVPASKTEQSQHFDKVKTGPILDKLGLTRYCCRRHMIAHVDLIDII